ncbi:hypothetical protein [Gymnodinialimonas hymeniacidonis]|uniref:hypothetical protein n=1 Tax=Gymnodinialimonas hymeniacidonis TaxID=3126508 RepID=UPI0034C6274C
MKDAIKSTTLAVCIVLGCNLSAQAGTLSGDEIHAAFSNETFQIRRMGMNVRVTYMASGLVRFESALMNGEGSWETEGDALCVTMLSGPRAGRECLTIESIGGGRYRTSDGGVLTLVR